MGVNIYTLPKSGSGNNFSTDKISHSSCKVVTSHTQY